MHIAFHTNSYHPVISGVVQSVHAFRQTFIGQKQDETQREHFQAAGRVIDHIGSGRKAHGRLRADG